MATLTLDDGNGRRKHPLDPSGSTLGRLPSCDIVLADPSVSRRHAAIWRAGDGWRVRDLNSRAGVKVDGRAVTDHRLRDGEVLQLGAVEAVVSLASEDQGSVEPDTDGHSMVSSHSLSASMLLRSLGSGTREDEVSALGRIVRTASHIRQARSAEQVAEAVLEEALQATGAERGLLRTIGEDGLALATYPGPGGTFSPSSTFIQRVLDEEIALIAIDVTADTELASADSIALQGVRSLLCAPLWNGTRVSGVLYLDRQHGQFDPDHIELVLALGYLGAAELDRLETAEHLAREKDRRRAVSRLLPQDIAEGLAAVSGEFELEEGRVALAIAEVVSTGEPDVTDVRELIETVLELVAAESAGQVVEPEPGLVTILHRGAEDPAQDVIAAAKTAIALLDVSEALRRTRSRWADLRLRTAVHVGDGAVGHIGDAEHGRIAVVGAVWQGATAAVKAGRPGRIRVSSEAGPDLAPWFDLVPEREGGAMAIWLVPGR